MIIMGIFVYKHLPDYPETTNFLRAADRKVAATRVIDEDDPDPMVHKPRQVLKRLPSALDEPTAPSYVFHRLQAQDVLTTPKFFLFGNLMQKLTIGSYISQAIDFQTIISMFSAFNE